MKTLVFVWTLKSVVGAVFFGSIILFVSVQIIKESISQTIKEHREKKGKGGKQNV